MPSDQLDQILAELREREPIFHRRAFGTSREALEQMIAPEFYEFGASGSRYTRSFVIETLLERYKTPESHDWPCRDFQITRLGDDLYLLSYMLDEPERSTRRSTIWRKAQGRWQIVFHQGTPALK